MEKVIKTIGFLIKATSGQRCGGAAQPKGIGFYRPYQDDLGYPVYYGPMAYVEDPREAKMYSSHEVCDLVEELQDNAPNGFKFSTVTVQISCGYDADNTEYHPEP